MRQPDQHGAGAAEQQAADPGAGDRDRPGGRRRSLGDLIDLLGHALQIGDGLLEEEQAIFDPPQAARRLGYPIGGGARQGESKRADPAEDDEDHEQGGQRLWYPQPGRAAHEGLEHQIEDEGEDDRQHDLAGEIEREQQEDPEDPRQQQRLQIPRQRHLRQPLLRFRRERGGLGRGRRRRRSRGTDRLSCH